MLRATLFLFAGGLAAQHSRVPPGAELCQWMTLVALGLCLHRRCRPVGLPMLGAALLLQAGQVVIDGRLEARFAGDSLLTQVRIVDFPRRSNESVVLVVEPLADARLPGRSRVTWFQPPVQPQLGDVWEMELRLRRPRGSSNPGVFDVAAWMFREKLHASGYVVSGKRNRLLWAGERPPLEQRRAQYVALARAAAESEEAAAVLAAVGVGARHLVSREQWERYALTGTSHLMAISGLHVGLAATGCFFVVFALSGLVMGDRNHFSLALAVGTLAAAAYALLAGFGVPARRAVLMLAMAAAALLRRREPDVAAAVALAAVVVFVTDPLSLLRPGFMLSFAAVGLLLWLARRRGGASRRWHGLIRMQGFLAVGLLPLTALLFQRFAVYATPVNLLAVPWFSFVTVPLTLAGLALAEVSERLALVPLGWAANSIEVLEAVLQHASRLPFADTRVADLHGAAGLLLLLPLLWVLLPRGWPLRSIGLLGACAVLLWRPTPPPESCVDAWVLDVGQGLAVVLQTRNTTWLYDTGMAYRGGASAAEFAILPFLRGRGISRLDRVIVSHADLDHSGGLPALRQALPMGEIVAGEPLPAVSTGPCHAGRRWRADGIEFTALHPPAIDAFEGNDASCVLQVAAGQHRLLLAGDIERRAERQLLQSGVLAKADVVLVPHHGSRSSSSPPLVAALVPQVAIVSAGYANRWGLPREEVTQRWRAEGAELLNTATSGAVGIRLCEGRGLVRLYRNREQSRRFWHDET